MQYCNLFIAVPAILVLTSPVSRCSVSFILSSLSLYDAVEHASLLDYVKHVAPPTGVAQVSVGVKKIVIKEILCLRSMIIARLFDLIKIMAIIMARYTEFESYHPNSIWLSFVFAHSQLCLQSCKFCADFCFCR